MPLSVVFWEFHINEIKKISVSQQGFDSQEDFFNQLIILCKAEPLYLPNELDLNLAGLDAKQLALKTTNSAVKTSTPLYTKAMENRDIELYKKRTGLVDFSKIVKSYCLSVLDASSAEYKKINHIHFKNF